MIFHHINVFAYLNLYLLKIGKFIFSLIRVDFEIWTSLFTHMLCVTFFLHFILLACPPQRTCACVCMYIWWKSTVRSPKTLYLLSFFIYTFFEWCIHIAPSPQWYYISLFVELEGERKLSSEKKISWDAKSIYSTEKWKFNHIDNF